VVDLLTRETVMCTPRQALSEMRDMRAAEKWFVARLDRIEKHLAKCQFRGRPLLDEPMSVSGIDAVLKEAWFTVNAPGYAQRTFERVLQNARRLH
jgi:hypothetical protein